jgi:hypothetical protein
MRNFAIVAIVLSITFIAAVNISLAATPAVMNYQGKLTNLNGTLVADGAYPVTLRIYDAPVGGNTLWSELDTLHIFGGLFSTLIGQHNPLPRDLFSSGFRYLGVQPEGEGEVYPRTPLVAVPRSLISDVAVTADTSQYAILARSVERSRDLYHQIIDINPNSTTKIPFIARSNASKVSIYVYGSEFQGALAAHTHTGTNSHSHSLSGTIASTSVPHFHGFSGTSATGGAAHSHSGTTASFSLYHSHSGTTDPVNLAHSHGGATSNDGHHHHDLLIHGYAQNGLFIVHASAPTTGLTADGGPATSTATGSVSTNPSDHVHGLSADLGNHGHNFTTSAWGGNHAHDFTTGSVDALHSHAFSGNTASNDVAHAHGFSGTISAFGSGIDLQGIAPTVLPTNVKIYVDGVLAAGPFSGAFSTGAIDLSTFVSGDGEHVVEIREEGGSGGRITYNLFVE